MRKNGSYPKEEGTTIKDVYKEWKALGQRAHGYSTSVCTRNEVAEHQKGRAREPEDMIRHNRSKATFYTRSLASANGRLCADSMQKIIRHAFHIGLSCRVGPIWRS